MTQGTAAWRLSETLCYLTHLEALGEVVRDGGEPECWSLAQSAAA